MDIRNARLPLEAQLLHHIVHIISDALDFAVLHFPIMDENAGCAANEHARFMAFEAEKREKIVE